jgi:hypothetical protein
MCSARAIALPYIPSQTSPMPYAMFTRREQYRAPTAGRRSFCLRTCPAGRPFACLLVCLFVCLFVCVFTARGDVIGQPSGRDWPAATESMGQPHSRSAGCRASRRRGRSRRGARWSRRHGPECAARRTGCNPYYICSATGLTPATSAPRLGSPLPHLHRDWAHPCHICTGI